MDVTCKRCQKPIPASDINLDSNIAKCANCNAVFDFRDQLSVGQAIARGTVESPKGIELQSTMDGLEIVRRWYSPKVLALLVFCIFWDGFMVVWFSIAIAQQQWAMALFGTIHGAIGVGITYLVVCGFVNRTYIRISFNDISIRHQPLPWPGKKRVPVGDIKQVFCKSKGHHNKNSTSYTYEVHYLDSADKENKLLPGLEKPEQALYIEQEIEKTLGIVDVAVGGELPRG
ncbi:MAG: hypothetical protein O7C75_06850 [Verrucomicrobia bacterium]|nr:hypothetical protein [Verrucomicrobiota bacterium]